MGQPVPYDGAGRRPGPLRAARWLNEVSTMEAKAAVPLGIIVGVILVLIWKSPSGSAEWLGDAFAAIGRFLERLANTIATFVGGLAD